MPETGRFCSVINGVELGFGIVCSDGVDASSVETLPRRRPAVLRVFAGVESMVERVRVVGGGCSLGGGGRQLWLLWFSNRGRSLYIGNAK